MKKPIRKSKVKYSIDLQDITVAVDAVTFCYANGKLEIALVERKYPPFQNMLAIPGGIVLNRETLEEGTRRELFEETGISELGLIKEVATFSDPNRDSRRRVISVAFLCLVKQKFELKADTDAAAADWFKVDFLPSELAFDHAQIIDKVLSKLKEELYANATAKHLLPDEFTLREFQSLYEQVAREKLEKRNFRKWLSAQKWLKPTGRFEEGTSHRPAEYYTWV